MYFTVGEAGKIEDIGLQNDISVESDSTVSLSGYCLPGLVNSHSHAFQVLLRGWGDNPKNFQDWVSRSLYPLAAQLNMEEISIASKVAYAQMVRNGITTVGEFHYLHNPLPDESVDDKDPISHLMIEAAHTVGIRQRFFYTGYDIQRREEQARFIRTPDQVIESLNKLKTDYSEDQLTHIGAAPHSLHGASPEMIARLVDWGRENNEIIHIHLSEQQSDISHSLKKFGKRPVHYLAEEGLLGPNLAIVHGIWVTVAEIQQLAANKVKHVYNPLTNMALGDGTAPILEYIDAGVKTAVGTDANISLDILKEVRTVEWLQRVKHLEMGLVQHQIGKQPAGPYLFDMATTNASDALSLPIGSIKKGNYADFIIINPHDLSVRPSQYFIDQLISSGSIRDLLKAVYIGGRLVFDSVDGFTNIEEHNLVHQFQSLAYGNKTS